jgi:hypothetical protein
MPAIENEERFDQVITAVGLDKQGNLKPIGDNPELAQELVERGFFTWFNENKAEIAQKYLRD